MVQAHQVVRHRFEPGSPGGRAIGESAMARTRQQQSVSIDRGLFLVRYATAEDSEHPPIVRLSSDPTQSQDIGFLLHPDQSEPVLWQPDTCMVVRALAPGKLSVEVLSAEEGGSTAATVRIEPLTQGNPAVPVALTVPARANSTADRNTFRILAHVTGLGDQFVKANEWIAGPAAPSRIEGIAIDWPDKPDGLEIRYAVKTAKPQAASGGPMSLGSFAGTRGKAMPVVGVMLEMYGPAATSLQFAFEAIFLGSPAKRISGKRVIATGPTGREPLVGLRLALEDVPAEQSPAKSTMRKAQESTGDATSGIGLKCRPSDRSSSATKIEEVTDGPSVRGKRTKTTPSSKSSAPTEPEAAEDGVRVFYKPSNSAAPAKFSSAGKIEGTARGVRVFRSRSKAAQPVTA